MEIQKKRKMLKYFTTFLVLISIGLFVEAQQEWTLEQCIQYAIEHNIQIKQQELQVELSQKYYQQSKAAFLPDLNASANNVFNYGQTIDPYTNSFASDWVRSNNFYISSNITLFNGFQLLNSLKQKAFEKKAAEFYTEKLENDVSLDIATAYLQILYNLEMLRNAESQMNISSLQLERSQKLAQVGTITQGDLLQIEAQLATDELQKVNAANNLDLSYLYLTQLMELDSNKGFTISEPEIDVPIDILVLETPENIYKIALSNQPQIKSAEYTVKGTEKSVLVARSNYLPTLTFRGVYGTGYSGASKTIDSYEGLSYDTTAYFTSGGDLIFSPTLVNPKYKTIPFFDQLDENLNYSLGFYLTIPIFNKFQVRTGVSAAKINYLNSVYNKELQENLLFKTIQQAHADVVAALKRFDASDKSVKALHKAFEFIEQKFNVGLVNSFDYNDAKNKLFKAQSERLQAKYEYIFRLKVLEFYSGKSLTL